MPRLPQPGKDAGTWGDILNDFLSQSHKTDGSLKNGVVGPTQLQPGAVTETTLSSAVQAKLTKAETALQSAPVTKVNNQTGDITLTKTDIGLSNVDNTADSAKPISTAQQTALDLKADTTALAGKLNTADLDAQTAAKITTNGSATQAALSSTYGTLAALGTVQAGQNGVTADGVTDDSGPLNALIAAVSASGGGMIQLPRGMVKLTTAIAPANNVLIQGAGMGRTILKPLQHGFTFTGTALAPLTNFHIRDLTIDGVNMTGTYKGYHGQYHRRCSWSNLHVINTQMTGLGPDFLDQCVISNVVTEDTGLGNDGTQPSGNGIGIGAGGLTSESFLVVGCTAIRAKRFGIMYEGGITQAGCKFIGNEAQGCEAGFNISGGSGAIVIANYAHRNVGEGILIGSGTLASSLAGRRAIIANNHCLLNGGAGIAFSAEIHEPAGDTCAIINNHCAENVGPGIDVILGANNIKGLLIAGNTLYDNDAQGVRLHKTGAGILVGCSVDGNTFIHNGSVSGYQITANVSLTGCSISNNVFENTLDRTSLSIGFGGTTTTLTGVRIQGNNSYGRTFLHAYSTTVYAGGTSIKDNIGHNPQGPAAITVSASPFTYTAGPTPEVVYISGGTVSSIVKSGSTLATATDRAIHLEPLQAVVVTYSVAPTMTKDRL